MSMCCQELDQLTFLDRFLLQLVVRRLAVLFFATVIIRAAAAQIQRRILLALAVPASATSALASRATAGSWRRCSYWMVRHDTIVEENTPTDNVCTKRQVMPVTVPLAKSQILT